MGVPVYDADAAVHRLQAPGGPALPPIEAAFPGVVKAGVLDRQALGARVFGNKEALRRLEAIVHPLVGQRQRTFLKRAAQRGERLVVLDIPLLFEGGGERGMDAVAVVTAPPDVQRARVLDREGMTAERLDAILAHQMPDAEKRARADFVIDTSRGVEPVRREVAEILEIMRDPQRRPRRDRATA
jgi:dephospho-CoA kinase